MIFASPGNFNANILLHSRFGNELLRLYSGNYI